jgi:hypothetical protein
MDIAFKIMVVLGLLEMLVGIVFFVRGQGESLAGLSRAEIEQRTRLKRLSLPLMAGGALMAVGAAVVMRMA